MMKSSQIMRGLAACGLLWALGTGGMTAAAGKPPAPTPVATFWFDNNLDVSGDAAGLYKDYRVTSGDVNDVDYCVEASPSTTGLFIRLNRKLDGDAGFQYCDLYASSTTRPKRDMTLHIASSSACNELYLYAPPAYVTDDNQGGCYFAHFAKPRIRISSDIFAKRATSTAVAFHEETYDPNDVSYEVQTDGNATVTVDPVNSNWRTVSSTGTAHLVRFVPGQQPVSVGGSFPLRFSIVIVKSSI
jgi:hypothetical protein